VKNLARLLAPLALVALAGCRTVVTAPQDIEARAAYQTVANTLPEVDFGWGESPSIARMAASERGAPKPERPDLLCDERRLKLYLEVFHPRVFELRYDAIEQVSYSYALWPNLMFCFVCPIFQTDTVRVVFDARKVEGLLSYIEDECSRLERISPEVGMSGPFDHAMAVRQKCRDDAREFGEGRLAFEVSYTTPIPPFVPYTRRVRRVAEAFAWIQAHPNEKPLDAKPPEGR
jgi:hypothetical protein